MTRKVFYAVCAFMIILMGFQSCKARKGCGCGNNMNYYNPKKGR